LEDVNWTLLASDSDQW